MENKLMIFENDAFGKVRTLNLNGEPWFVAADVCKALELGNPSMTVERLDDDEKGISTIDTLGGKQRMAIINEPGLYSLVITSRKPEAKAFKRWITHEVIPAIRKHGAYMTKSVLEQVLETRNWCCSWRSGCWRNSGRTSCFSRSCGWQSPRRTSTTPSFTRSAAPISAPPQRS